MKFKTKTSAYAFDEDLMKANGECSFSIQKNPFWNHSSWKRCVKLTPGTGNQNENVFLWLNVFSTLTHIGRDRHVQNRWFFKMISANTWKNQITGPSPSDPSEKILIGHDHRRIASIAYHIQYMFLCFECFPEVALGGGPKAWQYDFKFLRNLVRKYIVQLMYYSSRTINIIIHGRLNLQV